MSNERSPRALCSTTMGTRGMRTSWDVQLDGCVLCAHASVRATMELLIRREILLPVDRDVAWEAISDPAELETWLADEVDLEIEPGAEGTVRWDGGEERHAVVEEVSEGRHLALRWWPAEGGDETIVELTLDDHDDGTLLVVVELPVATVRAVSTIITGGAGTTDGPTM